MICQPYWNPISKVSNLCIVNIEQYVQLEIHLYIIIAKNIRHFRYVVQTIIVMNDYFQRGRLKYAKKGQEKGFRLDGHQCCLKIM